MAPEGRNALVRNVERSAREHVYALMWKDMQDRSSSKKYLPSVVRDLMRDLTSNVQHHLPGHGHGNDHGDQHASDDKTGSHTETAHQHHSNMFSTIFQEHDDAPDPDQLFEQFEKSKSSMLAAQGKHGWIATFKFGAQLPDMKEMLKKETIDTKQLKIVREVFLEAIRANYWAQLEQGRFVVGSPEPTMLLNSVSLAKEGCGAHLSDWDMLLRDIAFELKESEGDGKLKGEQGQPQKIKRAGTAYCKEPLDASQANSTPSLDGWRKWYNERRIEKNLKQQTTAIQVITAFIEAHQVAQGQVASYFGDGADIDSPEEAFVIIESQIEVFKASAMAGSIARSVHLRVNTMWKAHCLAEEYRKYVHAVADSGVLQSKEAEVLLHPISDTLRSWETRRRQIFRSFTDGTGSNKEPISEVEAVVLVQLAWRRFKNLATGDVASKHMDPALLCPAGESMKLPQEFDDLEACPKDPALLKFNEVKRSHGEEHKLVPAMALKGPLIPAMAIEAKERNEEEFDERVSCL